jgi:hypothetical protein
VRFFQKSCGTRVLVDEAAQDGSSVDRPAVEVGNGEMAAVAFAVGNALVDALVRPGRVIALCNCTGRGSRVVGLDQSLGF